MANAREVFVKITGKDGKPRIIDIIKENLKGLRGVESEIQSSTQKSNSYRTASYRAAEKDVAKAIKDRARWEKEISREISRTDKLAANDKIKEAKRASNAMIQSLKEIERESKQTAQKSSSVFSQSFGGSFFGNLAANAVSAFASKIAGIPSALRGVLDEAVKIAQDRTNAMKGVASIADFFNIPQKTAQDSIANLRLVKAGILDITDAATAYKNLIASGFTNDQAVQILERFSDAAAFGKQSALSFGEAISRAGEGIKNQNSALVDNVGLTKNLSVILKERGFELEDLSNAQTKQNALTALYNGIMVETQAQVGDADKITQGYTGAIAALDQAKKSLYGTIGDIITRNPELIALIKLTTNVLQGQTSALQENESASRRNAESMTSDFAKIAVEAGAMSNYVVAAFKEAGNFIALALTGAYTLLAGFVAKSGERMVNGIIGVANAAIDIANSAGKMFGADPQFERFEAKTGNSELFQKGLIQSELLLNNIGRSWNDATKAANNYRNTYQQILNDAKKTSGDAGLGMKPRTMANGMILLPADGSDGSGRSGSSWNSKAAEDTWNAKKLAEFAKERGFFVPNPTGKGGKHNEGSLHPKGLAVDIRTRDKTPEQIGEFVAQALQAGIRIVDERVRPAGQKVWSGAHLHAEYNPNKESYLSDQGFGSRSKTSLAELDRRRRLGADKYIESEEEKNLDKTLIAEAIEKKRQELLKFISTIGTTSGTIESGAASVSRAISPMQTPGEEYIYSLRESFDLHKRIEESVLRRMNHLKVMQVLYDDSVQAQSEDLLNAEEQLSLLRRQNADAEFVRRRRLIDATREQLSAEQELTFLQDRLANTPLIDSNRIQIEQTRDLIDLRSRETDAIIALNRAQLELSQKGVYSEIEANAKVLDSINQNIKSTTDIIADFKIGLADAALSVIDSPFAKLQKQVDKLPDGIRGIASTFVQLGNDIVRAFSHKIILRLLGLDTGGGGSSSGGFLSNIFGGLLGGGSGAGGTPNFNPNSFAGGSQSGGGNILSQLFGSAGGSSGGGGIFSTLGHEGSHAGGGKGGLGSIFGSEGFGNNVGTYGAIGMGASLLGSAIGGRVGGFLSGAGSGLAMGAQIGTMFMPGIGTAIGAGIGALVGGIASLLGGDPKRKADKKENLPALNQGFTDALAQLRQLVNDTKSLRIEPESALAKATELRQQIASGFGINFQSKKYQKQSRTLIASKLVEADSIIKQIREAADIAGAAGERRRRILPEFADGFALSNFARRNGLLSGGINGMDSLPSLLMPGEIVANQRQQNKIRSLAGFDVFAYADIPNYPKPKKMAEGGFVGMSNNSGFNANFEIKLVGVTLNPGSRMEITNKETQRKEFVSLYKDARKNKEI